MGCNCKKKEEPVSQPTPIPQTPEELHAQEITEWNGGVEIIYEKKEKDGE